MCVSVLALPVLIVVGGISAAKPEPTNVPQEFHQGEAKFNAHCAGCHGNQASGTSQGPPLVHKIYEPSHHGDGAFHRAAANGVRAHHWNFGNMPKIDGVSPEDVDQIIRYVRWLQRQAGIM
jgi:mono/diheme cytochrome c family protein